MKHAWFIFILLLTFVFGEVENLDEVFNRKQIEVFFPSEDLIGGEGIWQPETLVYTDSRTGHEVWKMSNTHGLINFYHNDIGVSPWSANGKRMAFVTQGRAGLPSRAWMVVDTTGSNLRAIPNAADPEYSSINDFFHWNPQIPDLFYEVGRRGDRNPNELYATRVADNDVLASLLLVFPETIGIDKMISPDGRMALISSYDESMNYPSELYPTASILDPDGYSIDRNMALYGTTPDEYSTVHDRYYVGDGTWYYIMPIGSSHRAWWRMAAIGRAADGGAYCDNSDFPVTASDLPYDFGECWPENADGGTPDPFGSDYWSHFVPDRWGRYALFSSVDSAYSDPLGPGPGTWDVQNHEYTVLTFGGSAQHHDWHCFCDWPVSSRGSGEDTYLNDRVYIQKYNEKDSQQTIAYTYTHYNGGGPSTYPSGTRPSQSPDGTKVAWQSEFLNTGPDLPDVFWTVAYYPKPPTGLEAEYDNGIRIFFLPPKYTDRAWPYANPEPQKNSLGWPLLDSLGHELGETLYAREIKQYHVWRSESVSGPWQEIGTVPALYNYEYQDTGYEDYFMLHPVDSDGYKIDNNNKLFFTDNPSSGTWYYALTSQEHSNLESDVLSDIIRVDYSGQDVSFSIVGEGTSGYWTTAPQAPQYFFVEPHNSGQLLTWTEPDDEKVRYYNIYYSETTPLATEEYRIASVPVGTHKYLDWLASTGNYGITTVDRQGNECQITFPGSCNPIHVADSDCSGAIELDELIIYVDDWRMGSVTIVQLMEAINLWK